MINRILARLSSILASSDRAKQPKRYKYEVLFLHCPPERRDACPVWQAGYDVAIFKDEPPKHREGCSCYRRYLGPMGTSSADFTRAEWQEWLEKSEQKHYFCSKKDVIMAAVMAGEVEWAFIEDGKPYRWAGE